MPRILIVVSFLSNSRSMRAFFSVLVEGGGRDEIDKKGAMSRKFMRKKLNFLKQT